MLIPAILMGALAVAPARRPVTIRFAAMVGGEAFSCSKKYPNIGTRQTTISVTDLRMYVHNVRLVTADGMEVPLTTTADGRWQGRGVILLDFEDRTGTCANGTRGMHTVITGTAPANRYVGLRFQVGVPFAQNHQDQALAPAPLDLSQMFWMWRVGYKFIRLDMIVDSGLRRAFLHLGSTNCVPDGPDTGAPDMCLHENRPEIDLPAFDPAADRVVFDLAALLAGSDLTRNQDSTAPGCMSAPDDRDCAPMFAALALPFGDAPAGAQRAFRVEPSSGSGGPAPKPGTTARPAAWTWSLPPGFPEPRVPPDNPMSAAKAELGRHLFYDPRMSVTGTFSCATCHRQELAFTDGKARSTGATGEEHPRGAMSLVNVAYAPVLNWANPGITRLEQQALTPMFGEHPVEMGLAGREAQLLAILRGDPRYRTLFAAAFPSQRNPYTLANVTRALATFQRTIIAGSAPYDRFRAGDLEAISPAARRGQSLFFSERLECFHCHGSFNLTGAVDYAGKGEAEVEFHNTGLYNIDGHGAYPPNNTGVMEITGDSADMGRFKAPTLRNVALTAPYMHDGSVSTLEDAVKHYSAGGRTVTEGPFKGAGSASPLKSVFVSRADLNEDEIAAVVAFLESLTDAQLLRDPRYGNPWADPAGHP